MITPITSRYFGNRDDAIAVHFHNGTEVLSGYIVKQIGLSRYIVSDGKIESVVSLAKTETQAEILLGELAIDDQHPASMVKGLATIVARSQDDVARIKRLTTLHAITIDGAAIGWTLDETGAYQIETMGHIINNEANGALEFNKAGNSIMVACFL